MNHITGTYSVKLLAKMGSQSLWHVVGNGVDRKVTLGENMPAVSALTRALEEEKEDADYLAARRAARMTGAL